MGWFHVWMVGSDLDQHRGGEFKICPSQSTEDFPKKATPPEKLTAGGPQHDGPWKWWFFFNIAIFGIYVKFLGCTAWRRGSIQKLAQDLQEDLKLDGTKSSVLDIKVMGRSEWYCWWLKSGVHQVRLVVYPIIYREFYIPGGAGFLPSTVFSVIQFFNPVHQCARVLSS